MVFGLEAGRCDHFFAVRLALVGGLVRFAGREGLHGWFHKKARGGVTKREGLVSSFHGANWRLRLRCRLVWLESGGWAKRWNYGTCA